MSGNNLQAPEEGGYGYMLEYPISRAYIDTRVNRIFGDTNEIMKEIISRMLKGMPKPF